MRWTGFVLIILLTIPALAECALSRQQRVAYLRKAATLLNNNSSGASIPGRSKAPAIAPVPAVTTGVFKVRAHQYDDSYRGKYVLVKKVHIHEHGTWALKENEWNTGRLKQFDVSIPNANIGQYYQVQVDWKDGSTYRWEYQMKQGRTVIDVRQPN